MTTPLPRPSSRRWLPRLPEMLGWLFAGARGRPIVKFDRVLHDTPTVLLGVRVGADGRAWMRRKETAES